MLYQTAPYSRYPPDNRYMTMPNIFSICTRALFAIVILAAIPGFSAAQSKARWEEYRSYEGRFRLLTPGAFRLKVDTISTDIGPLTYHTYFFEDANQEAENIVYMLSYCDYPEGSLHHDSTELVKSLFDATVEESAFSVAGVVRWSNDVSAGQYPGRIWRVDYKDGRAVIKTKAVLVRNRYYSIQAVMKKERSLNAAADKFLDSFRLLE